MSHQERALLLQAPKDSTTSLVQSGAWGEKGKPGSGRFAYADTSAIGGVTIELLWNQR